MRCAPGQPDWLPLDAIDRIEVVRGPMSTLYGSDAMGGVVNIITRKNFTGAEANAYVGQYGQGDGAETTYSATVGVANDRSGITDADIESQTTVDVLYTRAIGHDLDLALGVVNLTDEDPPLAQFALGYDPVVADPRGRVVSVGLTKRF